MQLVIASFSQVIPTDPCVIALGGKKKKLLYFRQTTEAKFIINLITTIDLLDQGSAFF
jgi:hypothetical protein